MNPVMRQETHREIKHITHVFSNTHDLKSLISLLDFYIHPGLLFLVLSKKADLISKDVAA